MRERLTDGLVNIGHDILVGSSIKIFGIFGVGGASPRFKLMVIVESQEEWHRHQRQGPIDYLWDWMSETSESVTMKETRILRLQKCKGVRLSTVFVSCKFIPTLWLGAATGAISPVGAGGGGGASAGERDAGVAVEFKVRRNICPKAAGQHVGVCGSIFLTV